MSGIATLQPTFILSKASLKELEGVKPELVATVKRAIEITIQDFTVFDGIRSVKEQQQHVANGTSQTMKSKHLDGLAVDLVPWVGKPVWEWDRDRKSVVSGKSVSVLVDLGGRRIIKKKNKNTVSRR